QPGRQASRNPRPPDREVLPDAGEQGEDLRVGRGKEADENRGGGTRYPASRPALDCRAIRQLSRDSRRLEGLEGKNMGDKFIVVRPHFQSTEGEDTRAIEQEQLVAANAE